jgi:hypothetical protein
MSIYWADGIAATASMGIFMLFCLADIKLHLFCIPSCRQCQLVLVMPIYQKGKFSTVERTVHQYLIHVSYSKGSNCYIKIYFLEN